MRRWVLWPFVLVPIVTLVSCGGGEVDLTDREIADEDLRLMVLTRGELGEKYADFELDDEASGFESNQERIRLACDPQDEENDIESFERLTTFKQTHVSDEEALQLRIILFKAPPGASGSFKDDVEDVRRQVGQTCDDIAIEDIQEFDAEEIAEESLGIVLAVDIKDQEGDEGKLYQTIVVFRRGRIVASARITRFDEMDVRPEVTALARRLDERIEDVLEGEFTP